MNKQITELLQQIADKLGTTAKEVWEIQLRQAKIEIVSDIFWAIFSLLIIYACYKTFRIVRNKLGEDWESDWDNWIPLWIMLPVISIIASISFCVNVSDLPTLIFNPQYWALQHLLK